MNELNKEELEILRRARAYLIKEEREQFDRMIEEYKQLKKGDKKENDRRSESGNS